MHTVLNTSVVRLDPIQKEDKQEAYLVQQLTSKIAQ